MTSDGGRPPGDDGPGQEPKPYFPPPGAPLPPPDPAPSGPVSSSWDAPRTWDAPPTWDAGGPAQPAPAPPPGWGPPPGQAPGWGPPAGAWGPRPVYGGPLPPLPPHLKQKSGPAIAISIAGVLLILGIGVGLLVALVAAVDASSAEAGDCVDFTVERAPKPGEDVGEAFAEKIDCDDQKAAWVVGVRLDNPNGRCPGEYYNEYFITGGPFDRYKLCLFPNVTEGDCFEFAPTKSDRYPCSQGERRDAIKILRIVDGVVDEERCDDLPAEDLFVLTFPTPPKTICYEPFGPSSLPGIGRDT